MTIHDLRHTAASLAISAGANVKAVQRMLGHKSAAMTLDVYADLFDDDLTAVSDASIRHARPRVLPICCHGTRSEYRRSPVTPDFSRLTGLPKWTRRRESNPQRLQV